MVESNVRLAGRRHREIPAFRTVSDAVELAHAPVTLFEVSLIAGDSSPATLALRRPRDSRPLIEIHAPAGGSARFAPAAPAFIVEPLSLLVSGTDAVGTIAYR
jgi:hypothetical protein